MQSRSINASQASWTTKVHHHKRNSTLILEACKQTSSARLSTTSFNETIHRQQPQRFTSCLSQHPIISAETFPRRSRSTITFVQGRDASRDSKISLPTYSSPAQGMERDSRSCHVCSRHLQLLSQRHCQEAQKCFPRAFKSSPDSDYGRQASACPRSESRH